MGRLELSDNRAWYHLSLCHGMNVNWFYDDYDGDPVLANTIDDICLSCPVRKLCLKEGIENQETGVWGGVYLSNGRIDTARNSHKTEEVWERIKSPQ